MGTKKRLLELIRIEREYFETLTPGTPEYAGSQERQMNLERQLSAHGESVGKNVIEGVKAAGGIVLPVFGWVVITAFEKDDSIRSSLKQTIQCFIPKRP